MKSTKSPSFCTTTFSASLKNLTPLLPQSRDCICYVSRPILAPPPFGLQQLTDLRAYDSRTLPACDTSVGSLTLPVSEAGDFVELIPINPATLSTSQVMLRKFTKLKQNIRFEHQRVWKATCSWLRAECHGDIL